MRFPIPLRRLLGFWAITFVCLYISGYFFFVFWMVSKNDAGLFAGQVSGPLIYAIFGWLYFRRAGLVNWEERIGAALIWITLSLAASALLIKPVYGYDWTAAINIRVLQGQLLNIAALAAAALVSGKGSKHPSDPAPTMGLMDGLEGPKF